MAEHPTPRNRSENSPGTREDKNRTFEDLRDILLAQEKREIAFLRDRIENPAVRAEDLSAVIAEAIELRREHGGQENLNKALTPSVEEALRESVRKDPSVLAGALFPVMGPAIRKSIVESIRSMLESFNQALEHSFSIEGIRWRIESMRTGKPFAEIVLLHSLLYRVEQVFLIHKMTGLLLGHCVAPQVATQDPTLVSGMLSAIQSFVRDSFLVRNEDSLDSLQVGELEVWVEGGPLAILAAVIRGHAPASYRATLEKTIEEIHRGFGPALERFDGDSAPLAAADEPLALCLESHYLPKTVTRRKPYLLILVLIVVVGLGIWTASAVRNQRKWSQFVEDLQRQPGIVVTSIVKEDGRYLVRGLRDPLAPGPEALLANVHMNPKAVKFQWTPFYALDDESIKRRAVATLQPPAGVTFSVREGVLSAEGTASSDWIRSLRDRAALVAGLKKVDTSKLGNADRSEVHQLETALGSVIFTFPAGSAQVELDEEAKFEAVAAQIKLLLARTTPVARVPRIEVIGHADKSGTKPLNLSLSQRRAEYVTRKLVEEGVAREYLSPRGVGSSGSVESRSTSSTKGGTRIDRSVTLRVTPSRPSQNP